MNERLEFIANIKDFMAVKKMKLDETKKPLDILQFLVSVQVTTNNKIADILEETIDLEDIKKQLADMFSLDISTFIKTLNNPKTKKLINSKISKDYDKKMKDALYNAVKVYLLEKYTKENKIPSAYHQILFPLLDNRAQKKAINKKR